jgi:hypothetical protein
MSAEEDDESDSWLRQGATETICFYNKVFRNFWTVAKKPRRSWEKLKNSRIANNFVFALFLSELSGLAVILVSMGVLSWLGCSKQTAVITAIAIAHYLLDAPFDFWLWPNTCMSLYPKKKWKAMYAADMGYFYLIGKVIDWLSLAFQVALALALMSYFSCLGSFAALVSHTAQIPFYVLAYTVLCVPMLLAREEELALLAVRTQKIKAKRLVFAPDGYTVRNSILAMIFFWRRKALMIELCEWIRLYCIQTRAGPHQNISHPAMLAGLFFNSVIGKRSIGIYSKSTNRIISSYSRDLCEKGN